VTLQTAHTTHTYIRSFSDIATLWRRKQRILHIYIRPFTYWASRRRRKQLTHCIYILLPLHIQLWSDARNSSNYAYINIHLFTHISAECLWPIRVQERIYVCAVWAVCGVFVAYSSLYTYICRVTPQTAHTAHTYILSFTHIVTEGRRKHLTLLVYIFVHSHIQVQNDAASSSHYAYIYSSLYKHRCRVTPQRAHATHTYLRPSTHVVTEGRRKHPTLLVYIFVSVHI